MLWLPLYMQLKIKRGIIDALLKSKFCLFLFSRQNKMPIDRQFNKGSEAQ